MCSGRATNRRWGERRTNVLANYRELSDLELLIACFEHFLFSFLEVPPEVSLELCFLTLVRSLMLEVQ